jgi:hypothetical protein
MAELLQLKNLFGTSFQAITYRCKDLGIIGEQLFKSGPRLASISFQRARRNLPRKRETTEV